MENISQTNRLLLRPIDWMLDFNRLIAIEKQSFKSPWNAERFGLFAATPGNIALAAELDGVLVGYMLCQKQQKRAGKLIHIAHIAVDPLVRSHGIGSALIASLLANLRNEQVTLHVRLSNNKAQALYERLGFFIDAHLPAHYADGEEALLMKYTPDQLAPSLPLLTCAATRESRLGQRQRLHRRYARPAFSPVGKLVGSVENS
ncbi:MAG: ribosomal-protein-alanine N-acetyltransferase [bacterium ADurb.Bin425]|jgi:ribosomal-protein-alanine N-acetyltransferase|nr:MAG: ribosomal-protein-alanine N-acetyltransferase [bacterium ADurb.Bin425]